MAIATILQILNNNKCRDDLTLGKPKKTERAKLSDEGVNKGDSSRGDSTKGTLQAWTLLGQYRNILNKKIYLILWINESGVIIN